MLKISVAITVEHIDLWRNLPTETQRIEFKEAKNQYDNRKLCGYCVAIANEGGGHLVLGIRNKPPREVVGTKAFNNSIEMAEKLFQTLGFRVDIEEVLHPDGRVVVFQIPSRPRGSAYHLEGAYLMRCGESLVPMTEDQLRKIFKEGEPDWLEQHSKNDLTAENVLALLDTEGFFQLMGVPHRTDIVGMIESLVHERLVDELNGRFAIRRLGAVLLARDFSMFEDIKRKAPRVVVYADSSKTELTQIDRTATRGYAVGFQRLVRFVSERLPQNEIIEEALRKKVHLVPDVVVRELLANALIHQDFTIGGTSVMIEIYPNRLEVSNPGSPVVPVERFIDGYQSRNERLADLMRRMGICEEKSSGIDRVVRCAEMYQLPAPDFRESHRRTVVVIYGPQDFEEMDREARIRACYQHSALKWVMSERMTNQSLRERFHLPESKSASVSQVIAATIENELIKPDEKAGTSRKFARYLPFWA
jgi:ATP-dependent DNA helicase RecG